MTEPHWLTDEEQRQWREFLRMQRRLFTYLIQAYQREFDLSAADYEILVNLSESSTSCPASISPLPWTPCWTS